MTANDEQPVVLGEKYVDSITGISGVATARTVWLYGCNRICLEFEKDQEVKAEWFDEQRLTKKPSATSGGPKADPSKRDGGSR